MPTFEKHKQDILKKRDKSSIEVIDKDILNLCKKINKREEYYTTSSCSGRIVLIISQDKKAPGLFLFKTHEKTSFKELSKELKKSCKTKKLIYFKMESAILHIASKDLNKAITLLEKAKQAGWKKSGILSYGKNQFVAELNSTEKLELPIIYKGKILVSDEYLKLLVNEANHKLEKTRKKIRKLENLI